MGAAPDLADLDDDLPLTISRARGTHALHRLHTRSHSALGLRSL